MILRITFIATLSPDRPTIVGRTLPLARALAERGHHVRLATLGPSLQTTTLEGIPVSVVGPSLRGTEKHRPSLLRIATRLRNGTRSLTAVIQKDRPDIVVVVKPHPQNIRAVQNTRVPIVLDTDDDEIHASRLTKPEQYWMRYLDKQISASARCVTACSPALVQHYEVTRSHPRVECIPTSIATEEIETPNLRAKLGIPASSKIILYLGSINISSGHRLDHVLSIWDEIAEEKQNLHLVIAGDGIDMDSIRARAATLTHRNRVHFSGRFHPHTAVPLARQANVLIDPTDRSSQAEAKSSSRTLYAIRSKTPLVAANGGIRSVILPNSLHARTLYDPENLSTLVEQLRHALLPQWKDTFVKEIEHTWNQWSWDHIGTRFCSIIESLKP